MTDKPTKEFIKWAHKVIFIPDGAQRWQTVQDMWLSYLKGLDERPAVEVVDGPRGHKCSSCGNYGIYACGYCACYPERYKHCPDCGSRLDWSKIEGVKDE